MKTALSLSDSQVYTLRRLNGGTRYLMRGDGLKANEQRPDGPRSHRPVNAPSIPVLYRLGLVDFVIPPKAGQATSWHRVTLTYKGLKAVRVVRTRAERGL